MRKALLIFTTSLHSSHKQFGACSGRCLLACALVAANGFPFRMQYPRAGRKLQPPPHQTPPTTTGMEHVCLAAAALPQRCTAAAQSRLSCHTNPVARSTNTQHNNQRDNRSHTNRRRPNSLHKPDGPRREAILDLNRYKDQLIRVKFTGGRQVVGTLKGFDQLMNLVLDDVTETLRGMLAQSQALQYTNDRPRGRHGIDQGNAAAWLGGGARSHVAHDPAGGRQRGD